MSNWIKKFFIGVFFVSIAIFPSKAHALILMDGTGSLGSFTGSLSYNATDSTSALLTIFLTNTSPAANGGYLTAFAFNNPSDLISNVTLNSSDPDFAVIGGTTFQNTINGSPNGQFDIGASTGGGYEGIGAPQPGIAAGDSANFFFSLTGTNLTGLTENSFISELSTGPGDGAGPEAFVTRFRGFNNGGSDKVPANFNNPPPPGTLIAPEPTSMFLLSSGLVGAFLIRRKKTI